MLEQANLQLVLGELAEKLVGLTHEDPLFEEQGLGLNLTLQADRRDLVAVVRLLLEQGVLSRVDGDEQRYLNEQGDVLYTLHRPVLVSLLNVRQGPSTLRGLEPPERLAALVREIQPETGDARNQFLRQHLTRRLLEEPVVYYDSLSEPERAYLQSQRLSITRTLTEATRLHPEIRREGIAMVDEGGALSDVLLPQPGTVGHATLLMTEWLADLRRSRPDGRVALGELHIQMRTLVRQYGELWSSTARQAGEEKELVAQALYTLQALQLVQAVPEGIRVLPAIHRFAVRSPTVARPASDESSTLDTKIAHMKAQPLRGRRS